MRYDLAIIGGGPGGYSAAFEAVKRGLKVILFEKDLLGGTCLNRGCVPTKYLSHVAEKISEFNELQKYGIGIEGISINPALMQKQNYEIVGKLRDGLCQRLQQEKVIIIHAQAKIISPDCVMADGNSYSVNNIIIAAGASSEAPFIDGATTTDTLLKLEYIPERLRIIGGGVIAVEFANIYRRLGADVTMCLRGERLLRKFDKEISRSITQNLKKQGIKIIPNCTQEQMQGTNGEVILSAIGRRPNIKGIIADELNLCIQNGIVTDAVGRTNIPGIYAIGDVVSENAQLAHVAMEQGRRAVHAICGDADMEPYSIVNCIYITPEVAVVGLNEEKAREKGIAVISGKQVMSANARTLISTDERGFIKILAESKTGIIVGAQLMCERASDIVAELALAIDQHLTVDELLHSVRPHPSYCEAVTDALLNLKEKLVCVSNI